MAPFEAPFRNVIGYTLKYDVPVYSNGVMIPGAGLHDFNIDHNIMIGSDAQWRILAGRGNIYLNCRNIDDMIPYTGNAKWNDC